MEYEMMFEVTNRYTAKELGSGTLNVLGTPGLIAMVENVCMNAIEKDLESGYTSVGSSIDINHMRPSIMGALIKIVVMMKESDGKSYHFTYKAYDQDKVIATGKHTRVKVNTMTFMERIK
ncbi:thioesterase family protein [Vagococcus bubulae]|uniref:Fluoroacetyl-CoA-specific thioesterase-like domain-containing protein n=1 Tax=Vagococcus bubulae TaxID=1977868 RepID=A0A429ZIJ2_9ENTE|nr:thioesterase family protein [Vagococcus bubulae]RST93505.1 hypothetical protein CBF36_07730 [Vagococcus bubulae]